MNTKDSGKSIRSRRINNILNRLKNTNIFNKESMILIFYREEVFENVLKKSPYTAENRRSKKPEFRGGDFAGGIQVVGREENGGAGVAGHGG